MSIPGVCQKKGKTYRRFRVKRPDGKWGDVYVSLPDPTDPRFAEELARVNRPAKGRPGVKPGSIAALLVEFRPVLKNRTMSDETRRAWTYYLGLIENEHGAKLVADLRKSDVIKLRDAMGDMPGKANAYVSKLRDLMEFAVDRDWIKSNPAENVPRLELGEYDPWPADVIEAALAAASPMVRLAIVTGLCSGQRISDIIRMQHGWHDGRIMEVRSKKTDTDAAVPMHPLWLAEIKKIPRKAVTLLYDRSGKPFADTDRLQASMRRLMRSLGYVTRDKQGRPLDRFGMLVTEEAENEPEILYSFHGLGKNACCYLTELGCSDTEISAMTGKTPETVRHYAKRARVLMVAKGAAKRVIAGRIGGLK